MSQAATYDAALTVIPYELYRAPKKQYGAKSRETTYFTRNGEPGILLQDAMDGQLADLDDANDVVFHGLAQKVGHVIDLHGYERFKVQKYARSRKTGYTKAKATKQIAEVTSDFLEKCERASSTGPLRLGKKYINLRHLYLLELRHVSEGSYQPVFGVRREEIPDDAVLDPSLFASSELVAPTGMSSRVAAELAIQTTEYGYRCGTDCPICASDIDNAPSAWAGTGPWTYGIPDDPTAGGISVCDDTTLPSPAYVNGWVFPAV